MKTIRISDGIELVICDDGGIALKDLFNDKSIGILPEELEAMASAIEEARMYRVADMAKQIARKSSIKICTCSGYQLEKYGCVCQKNLR